MSIPQLTDWKSGDDIRSRSHHQEPVDAIRYLLSLPGAAIARSDIPRKERGMPIMFGTVTDEGPNGEIDFPADDGQRHWVTVGYLDGAFYDDDTVILRDDYDNSAPVKNTVVGHNLSEDRLSVGTPVALVPVWTNDDPIVLVYLMIQIGESKGQYEEMVHKNVANNVMGHDFVRLHAPIT